MRCLSFIVLIIGITVNLYSQTRHPHGDDFKLACETCHETESWKVNPLKIKFDHSSTKFDLTGQHQIADCKSCHTTLVFASNDPDCISCHTDIHKETVGKDCAKCHTPDSWIVQDINNIHQTGRFPLLGKHLVTDCIQCHSSYVDLVFEPLNTDCYDCHIADYLSTSSPNHTNAGFSTDCQDCHPINSFSWTAINVVHDFFPLVGGHSISDCFACHEQGTGFSGLSSDCYSCHQQDYENVNDPNHVLGNFPTDCSQCHTINAWIPATIDHNATAFPLTGKHINVDCSQCHSNGYAGTPTDCYACHQSDYENINDPNHISAGFSTDCLECHTTDGWDGANFDHNITGFELTGAHLTTDCLNCHASGFTGTPTDCFNCHEGNYNNASNPNHIIASFPTTCEDCHTTSAWTPAAFDHNFYAISSQHNDVTCNECHSQANYQPQCLSCHQDDFNEEHDPGDPTDCWSCHSTFNWDSNFDHNNTNFPLTGAHLAISCQDCHSGSYQGTPTECLACHETNYNNTTNPDHEVLMLPTDCQDCHTTNPNWQPAQFPQHDQVFQLLGRHLEIINDCDACHNGDYNNTPNTCYECHTDAYNNATNPEHVPAGISTLCEDCHNSTAWVPSTFNHTATGFELIGAHSTIQCSSCHLGTTGGLQSDCISCHQNDYNSAPDHLTLNYPTDCEICHNSVAWDDVIFDHANTNFPLTGAHTSLNCNDCHSNGYTGTTTICYDCHQTAYQQTTNPNHVALSLPTDCQVCHTTNPNWQPATFPIHDNYFELLGAHAQINNCDDCHNGNYNNTPNTCMGCHANDYNGTNDPPHQSLGFPEDCLICHNMNGWTPASFDHGFYPISNRHNNVNCNECHSEPNYQPQCLSCHQDDFNEEHDPGDPTDCWSCHTTSNWDSGLGKFELQNTH